jgi:hypothetical protein
MLVAFPAAAHAQTTWKTACNDGTRSTSTGSNACDGHGGIHHANTIVLRRAQSRTGQSTTKEPARVAQAGKQAQPGEHRGWRWSRHRDADKHEEKRVRVRCRDGKYDEVKQHGKGRGKDVCKHHGGLAH